MGNTEVQLRGWQDSKWINKMKHLYEECFINYEVKANVVLLTKRKSVHLFLWLVQHKSEIFTILQFYKPWAYGTAVTLAS